jgi:DNA-binding NarL/FixJ family response regulator
MSPGIGTASSITASRVGRTPRAVIADDHAIVAAGLRRLLETQCEVLAVAADGVALVEVVQRLQPDLVVTDLSMPRRSGVDAIRIIRRRWPQVRIVCLSMHQDRTWLQEALTAGAQAYVVKHAAAEELLDAIRVVRHGGVYVSPVLAGSRRVRQSNSAVHEEPAPAPLTNRQLQVLQLVAEGRSLRQIADQLHLSAKTVEFHKSRIKVTLGLDTTAQLIQYAVRHGIVAE